jgi:hypothetical protein
MEIVLREYFARFETSEVCSHEIERPLRSGDCLLVKGSLYARMRVVVSKLEEITERIG